MRQREDVRQAGATIVIFTGKTTCSCKLSFMGKGFYTPIGKEIRKTNPLITPTRKQTLPDLQNTSNSKNGDSIMQKRQP